MVALHVSSVAHDLPLTVQYALVKPTRRGALKVSVRVCFCQRASLRKTCVCADKGFSHPKKKSTGDRCPL